MPTGFQSMWNQTEKSFSDWRERHISLMEETELLWILKIHEELAGYHKQKRVHFTLWSWKRGEVVTPGMVTIFVS